MMQRSITSGRGVSAMCCLSRQGRLSCAKAFCWWFTTMMAAHTSGVSATSTLRRKRGRAVEEPVSATELIRAAERGDTAAIQRILATNVDINSRDERGRTAVMAATHARQVAAVRQLLEAGADVNIRDNRLDN